MPATHRLNWIIQQDTDQGPLNDGQIMKLVEDFDLPESDIRTLSWHLAFPLSEDFTLRGAIEVVKGIQKGPVELEKVIKELRHAQKRIGSAIELYSRIRIQFPAIKRGVADPNNDIRDDLDRALFMVERLNERLTRSSAKYRTFSFGHRRNGRVTDDRRIAVLDRIFDAWDAAGRKVSVTTIGSTSERTGPLIDFTNAVVRCLTEPPTEISGETIWSDMKRWRLRKQTDPSVRTADE